MFFSTPKMQAIWDNFPPSTRASMENVIPPCPTGHQHILSINVGVANPANVGLVRMIVSEFIEHKKTKCTDDRVDSVVVELAKKFCCLHTFRPQPNIALASSIGFHGNEPKVELPRSPRQVPADPAVKREFAPEPPVTCRLRHQ
jgi:hypothetical protein